MSLLFTNARLIDPEQGTEHTGSLLVKGDTIAAIDPENAKAERVVDCGGKYLAPGIVDLGVKVGEPGERHKESFKTAGAAAAAGGVTTIVCRPDTDPAIDAPETLQYALRRGRDVSAVRVEQLASLTRAREGREMVEIGFLQDAGALAFTDCDTFCRDTKVLSRCMTYAAGLGALIIGHPQEPGLSAGAAVTSGKFATLRGLPGVSTMAERMGLERDLALVEMTGVAYHADQITTAAGLEVLTRAKAKGLNISAGTSIHHATLNAFDVDDYRTFFKVKPPLRAEEDRMAVVEALADGTIDILCSMHTPQDEESKRLPFEEAASGAVGLETLLPAALRLVHGGHMDIATLWKRLSLAPANRLGLPSGRLTPGAPADLVLFDATAPFVLDRSTLRSKSKNTPYDGHRMEGRVLATYVGGACVFEPGMTHVS